MAKKVKKGIGKEPYRLNRITREDNLTVFNIHPDRLKIGDVLQITLRHPLTSDKKDLIVKVDKRMTRKSVIARFNKFFKDNDYPAIMK